MKRTYSISEIDEIAESVLAHAQSNLLLFYGSMGVGKTTLIKAIAKLLGVKETLQSPTFSLVNEYEIDHEKLYHFDFYRIDKEEEAMDIGFEEYLQSGGWNLIEWPEKIVRLLPQNSTNIKLTQNLDGNRTIELINMK